MKKAYKYQFREGIDVRDVEDTLLLACVAAEGLFGEARVRLDTCHCVHRDIRAVGVDASTDVGLVVNAIFTAFILKEFGRDGFTVQALAMEACQ